jgi:AcrR family transcriptional regulator
MTSGPSAADVAGAVTAAARSLFVSRGYAKTTMKSVATAAGVAPSIVSSMYRNKEQLFTAAMTLPFDPVRAIPLLVAPGLDGMGERIVRLSLGVMSDEQVDAVVRLRMACESPWTREDRRGYAKAAIDVIGAMIAVPR